MSGPEQEMVPGSSGPTPEPDPPRAEWDPLKRNIAITLAALVLLGAGLAILQVDASANESNSARETTRTAVQAMRANVVADTVSGLQPVLQAERDFLPFRRPLAAGAPSLAEAAGLSSEEAQTAASLLVAQQAVPDLGVGRLLVRLQAQGQRLTLKQRALATTRITWNDRSTQYTTVIAVLAVALFLVGFGLVAEGPVRRTAYGMGLTVGLFAAAWGVWVHQLPIPTTPDAAIDAAASGAVLTADGDYRGAVDQYDKALAADDAYATAFVGRSRARLLAANPDYATTRAATDLKGASFAAAVRDAQRAHDLDARDSTSAFLLALTSFYSGAYEAAENASEAVIELNPRVPDPWLLRSAAQVALGHQAAATASLDHALSLVRGAEPSQRTRLLAATYLSYLAWVAHDVPARAAAAAKLSDRIVAAETRFTLGRTLRGSPPRRGSVGVARLRFADNTLTLRLRWSDLPPRTALSAIGYERPLPGGPWTQPADLALFATVAGSGTRDIAVPLRRTCKPTEVRVDVYVNGVRTLTRTGPGVSPTC